MLMVLLVGDSNGVSNISKVDSLLWCKNENKGRKMLTEMATR